MNLWVVDNTTILVAFSNHSLQPTPSVPFCPPPLSPRTNIPFPNLPLCIFFEPTQAQGNPPAIIMATRLRIDTPAESGSPADVVIEPAELKFEARRAPSQKPGSACATRRSGGPEIAKRSPRARWPTGPILGGHRRVLCSHTGLARTAGAAAHRASQPG